MIKFIKLSYCGFSVFIEGAYLMHRKSIAELLPLDTKIEKTLRNMKKVREFEKEVMVEQS